MYRVTIKAEDAKERLARLKAAMTPDAVDPVIEREAFKTQAALVKRTPKRFFGQVRLGWQTVKQETASYRVENLNKIMGYLEHGTGQSTGGFIYPKTAKALFVTLTRQAALATSAQAKSKLKYGVDYVLAKRVRGIKAMKIVATMRPEVKKNLLEAMKSHLRKALQAE